MIKKIYSKTNKDLLLHLIFAPDDKINNSGEIVTRTNIAPDDEFLQAAHILIKEKHHRFKPHIHNEVIRHTNITQEAWIVLNGVIRATYFDVDKSFLCEEILYPGWMTMTFRGGHTYESLEENTESIEIKLGPYSGQQVDKEMIEE